MKGSQSNDCNCLGCLARRRNSQKPSSVQVDIAGFIAGIPLTQPKKQKVLSAAGFLVAANQHMKDRAVTYDSPEGERSMERTVAAFNELKGTNLSVQDGWTFMMLLKMVRADQGEFKADNFEDLVAYAALAGEQASIDAVRKQNQQNI
ncbi:DUF6378 domain-containing protein [Acinetobacter sp. A47]|uniref:DUF6378 domain-containing protein n=1 Tax=Acinetobacter sp. A47 TaxID=1561217 RepID=UPI0006909808|nr:DUF6378 domain-containing protein [Acinetobacter sp. A47]